MKTIIKEYLVEAKIIIRVKVPIESSSEWIQKAALSELNNDLEFGFIRINDFNTKILDKND
jgi:hypothetical protein